MQIKLSRMHKQIFEKILATVWMAYNWANFEFLNFEQYYKRPSTGSQWLLGI